MKIDSFGFQWHITNRCQGGCRHCYQDRFDGNAELPLDELKHIAAHIMTSINVPVSVNITGGEPLVYPQLFELMKYLGSFAGLEELNLITSTHGLNLSIIDELKSIPSLTYVKVSLESHEPEINDNMRGEGNFKTTTRNIKMLTKAGLSVILMATLGKHNYHCVEGLCKTAVDFGARGIIFERYVPLGKGISMSDLVLTLPQWQKITGDICRVAALHIPQEQLLKYRAFWINIPRGKLNLCSVNGALCNLGSSSMALMPDGTVYPCRRFPLPIGKLPNDDMDRILGLLSQYAQNPQQCYNFDF